MHLLDVSRNLERRQIESDVAFVLAAPASEVQIQAAEQRLGLSFPPQVRLFYLHFNGLSVVDPPLEILAVERLQVSSDFHIEFAIADNTGRIAFDVSQLNNADQWTIVNADSAAPITMTLASFWSNKIWKWIDRHCRFWEGEL